MEVEVRMVSEDSGIIEVKSSVSKARLMEESGYFAAMFRNNFKVWNLLEFTSSSVE